MNAAVASSSDPPPQPPPAVASSLAPGFRFHPTDDELVSYYLKRKVRGLPLRVDAVAEVDLYRCEPWELPGLSRIRSRDKEWYFFSSLGRKYSTQSRTNRATSQGYWKTTGKDRPVRRGTRVIGMKKTLVFHAGRAPRGTRTNWVMHEYRLDDEELIKTGISQDAYVICRIFEKCGSGPMNGAQYGAPFLEEEWEEEADGVVLLPDGGDYVATKQEFFELSDFMQSEDSKNQQENASNFTADLDRKECGSLAEDATNFPDEIIEDDNFTNLADDPKQQSVAAVAHEMEKQPSADDCIHNQDNPNIKEEYVELGLGDLADTINATNLSYQEYDNYPMKTCHLQDMDAIHQNINLRKMLEVEEYFDFSSEDAEQPEQQQIFQPEDNIYVQPNNFNFVDDGSPSSQDKMALCNAPSDNLFLHENTEINGLLYSPTSGPSDFEMVDDLLAFFDATNDNLHCCSTGLQCISPPDTFDFVEEVGCSTSKATTMVPHTTIIDGASSSGSSVAHVESGDEYKEIVIKPKPDDPTEEPNNKTAKKHLMSVLGAISPRAPFSEFPSLPGKLSAAHVASPVHVTAGIIQIYGSTIPEDAANWPLQKNGRVHFIFSYSVVDDMVSKTAGHDLTSKYQINPVSTSLQGGLYLIFVSWLILAIAYGVGMRYMAKKFYTTDS